MDRKFKVGELVLLDSGEIGKVGWIDNKACNIKLEDKLLGVDILTGSKGFAAGVHEDKCLPATEKTLITYFEEQIKELTTFGEITLKELNKEREISKQNKKLDEENRLLKELIKFYM